MKGVPWSGWSLRSKLIVACVLVQLVAAALVLLGSTQLLQRALLDQASSQAKQIVALLDYAIAAPLAQRDYATLQQSLDLIRSDESITYLVLSDHRGKLIATAGWDAARPLPSRDDKGIDLERPDATMHLALPVSLAGQPLGHVDFGLSTAGLRQARADFLRHSLGITGAALAISMALLTVIAFAITHRLTRLAHASQRVARGDLDATVPVTTNDEVGRLGISFNAMAETLKLRVAALEHSETQQRLLLKAAREEQARLTTLLGAMNSGIMFVGSTGRVIYANAAFARIWALADLTTGRSLAEVVPLLIRQTIPADAVHVEAMLDTAVGKVARGVELQTVDGRIITQRMQPVAEGSSGSGCIWFHEDITLERQTQQRAYQALHDPLTKLLNRRGLYEALQAAIAQAIADNAPLALLFIDLDDFKHANDVGGHRTGDEILVAVAQTLSDQMRKGELAARLGGDEFAVLCPGNGAHAASAIAARLVEAVGGLRFAAADMQTLRIGCSIGIATCPSDARDEDDLVACADTAMYLAKQSGKNGWAVYHNDPLRSRAESARGKLECPHQPRLAGSALRPPLPGGASRSRSAGDVLRSAGAHGGRERPEPTDLACGFRTACRTQRQGSADRSLGLSELCPETGDYRPLGVHRRQSVGAFAGGCHLSRVSRRHAAAARGRSTPAAHRTDRNLGDQRSGGSTPDDRRIARPRLRSVSGRFRQWVQLVRASKTAGRRGHQDRWSLHS
jgi:diguanylate cyclase (GGDEF)-like protein